MNLPFFHVLSHSFPLRPVADLAHHWRTMGAEKRHPSMPNVSSDTINYFIQASPGGSLDVALACAADGQPHWQALFEHGLIGAVVDDPRVERRLFNHLCIDAVQIHGNPLLTAYLAGLSPKHSHRIFSDSTLQDKNHPVNHVFSKAALRRHEGHLHAS